MMTQSEYDSKILQIKEQEDSWKREKEVLQRELSLKEDKKSLKTRKSKTERKKTTTTKLIVWFILINCTIVEIYSMWVMYKLMDLSALSTMITAIIGEAVTLAVYCVKSAKENTSGGIVYESMRNSMMSQNQVTDEQDSSDSVG